MHEQNLGETLAQGRETRIHLCGRLTARLGGERVEGALPGRQGRILFAYLAAHRMQTVPRDELLNVLWPDEAPAAAEGALAALLAKLRKLLGAPALVGKHEIRLLLPAGAWVDVEAAADGLHRGESAAALKDWARAWGPARVALHIAARRFMPGYDAPWITDARRRMDEMLLRAHECVAESGLGMGGAEMAAAERSARRLIELAPLRESGYRLLMRALAARDNTGEALMVYEELRRVLRKELGIAPGAASQQLHRSLLKTEP
ncbi:MAG: winged helix-turn-helix domain-containing protein [Burkholderiales bacterium]|nr:winged helix-turn-helix domain-containing protein [Burkholderiales bacterium]